uniref:Uncharacterized protein n=1 Tax=Plectus sambesii TaxID=2011161 RepID=A0A914XEZ0_9BILA
MEVKPILETDWPAKPRKPVKYDEVPVEELDVPVEALASGQAEQLGSAEIVRLTKTKSATLTPKTRNFPTVKSSVEEQSTSPAPESEVAEQRRAPSISERIVSAGALESEPIDVVDPNLEGQAEEAIPQKWQNVCPPASKPILVGKEKQLSSCLPRRNTCPVGSFCWFSTEEDYICCTEPRQPNVELPPSEPSLLPSSELSAGSAELPPTDDSEQPLVYGAETISAVQNITEYDISSEQNAELHHNEEESVSAAFGREKSAIWFKPQPQAGRVEQASQGNETVTAATTQLNETISAEEVSASANNSKSARRRTEARQQYAKEESELASSYNPKSGVSSSPKASASAGSRTSKLPTPGLPSFEDQAAAPQYEIDASKASNLPNTIHRKSQYEQPQSRYVPNPAGGYSRIVSAPQTEEDSNGAAKEAAMEYYLTQIRNGWPYADEFYVPAQLNADQAPVQRDAVPVNVLPVYGAQLQQPASNGEYNYDYARWQDQNSRVRWYKKK